MQPQPEQIGPYKILSQLGEGGMGAVYEAIHPTIERRVALKVLLPELAQDAGALQRFSNEARAVNLIGHPSLVQISEFGRLPDGTTYIVMELLRGHTLASRMSGAAVRLQLGEILQICMQVAAALAVAHERGVVHRDLKPENLMLVPDRAMPGQLQVKILDFGIAKFSEELRREQVKTRTGMLLGTPRYMAPEQCRGADQVTDRADVYALGVILFELLAGRPLFVGQSAYDVIAKHIYEPAPALSKLRPELPRGLCDWVMSLLSKDPGSRPDMKEVRATLATWAHELDARVVRRGRRVRTAQWTGAACVMLLLSGSLLALHYKRPAPRAAPLQTAGVSPSVPSRLAAPRPVPAPAPVLPAPAPPGIAPIARVIAPAQVSSEPAIAGTRRPPDKRRPEPPRPGVRGAEGARATTTGGPAAGAAPARAAESKSSRDVITYELDPE